MKRIAARLLQCSAEDIRLAGGAAFPAFKASGDITSLSQADGYIEIAPDQSSVEQGTMVEVTLF